METLGRNEKESKKSIDGLLLFRGFVRTELLIARALSVLASLDVKDKHFDNVIDESMKSLTHAAVLLSHERKLLEV